ncbi:pali-domain-containing protein [Athelia psychrophila]|uniref:Pali-domain-containing protein n=1 Tax=Athelia psychrophila TaxID=1759441 RepID=A0A166N8H6_9AGAM|nr:pali-domain-containing protein [Fibularhizoctonia sp. CBS 109695]
MLAIVTPVLLFISFLLLLLVTLSVPIARTIYLFDIIANVGSSLLSSGASGSVKFGVFGYCLSGVDVSVFGSQHNTSAECSKPHLGYTFDQALGNALHISGYENLISRALTAALVLHPIACGLTFLALLMSLFMTKRGQTGASRVASLFTLGSGILAALITTIAFFIDVGLVASVRHKVRNDTNGDVTLNWGNAVWMILGAAVGIWAAVVGACASLCGGSRRRKGETY